MQVQDLSGEVDRLTRMANNAEDEEVAADVEQEADVLAQKMAELEGIQAEARKASDLMMAEIEDNLVECEYPVHCRAAIHDATVAGTGFIKGPIPLTERVRKSWMREDGGNYRLKYDAESEGRFAFQHVSYWHLFPEPTARSFDKCSSWLERHIMTEQDLRDFAKQPGVDKDAIRQAIWTKGPATPSPNTCWTSIRWSRKRSPATPPTSTSCGSTAVPWSARTWKRSCPRSCAPP